MKVLIDNERYEMRVLVDTKKNYIVSVHMCLEITYIAKTKHVTFYTEDVGNNVVHFPIDTLSDLVIVPDQPKKNEIIFFVQVGQDSTLLKNVHKVKFDAGRIFLTTTENEKRWYYIDSLEMFSIREQERYDYES